MFKNYFKIAFRHLLKSRLYSVINIIGLACGITCILLAVLYWKDERSFDEFHKANPHLYRITTSLRIDKQGNRATIGSTGQVQGPAFKEAAPEIKEYTRIMGGDIYNDLASENKTLHLRMLFVDTSFFSVFSFKLVKGNRAAALKDINGVVITESTARKFFNRIDVIGKVFSMDADPSFKRLGKPLIVSGVVEDPPGNSSLQFDALLTFAFLRLSFEDHNWLNAYLGTFVVLHPDASIHAVTEKFNAIYALHGKKQINGPQYNNHGFDPEIKYGLQPITDIHLNNGLIAEGSNESGVVNASSPVYSYVFMGIALFILLMAAINFINISIAASLKRAKEVGVRKISGGNRRQIITQFLLESALLCIIAFVLSILLVNLMLPLLNTVTGKQLLFENVIDWRLIFYFAIVLIVIILLTGFYPAIVLSNFKASEVLYNKQRQSGRNFFGRGLVVLQFSLAVFLLVAAFVYYTQMQYVRTKDLGYNPYNIIHTKISGNRDYPSVIGFMKNELAMEPSIKTVSFGSDGWVEDVESNNSLFKAKTRLIDENYLSLMQIPLKQGRNLSMAVTTDSKDGALVNEAFVKATGWKEPIGQAVLINRHYDSLYKRIVGVVKDYHFGSLREPINPMLMYIPESAEGKSGIWINFDKAKQSQAMAAVERIYKAAMPNAIYKYDFIDELNAREYLQEKRWQQVVNFSAVVAFVLCCLGLFGLTHLAANRRIKEIGVRKVLGATVSQVISLLTAGFLKLVLISLGIAFPVAWLVMNRWLQNYAYRIEINWWIFIIAGLVAIFIAIITTSFQTIKAATANPIKSLRTE